MDSLAFSLLLIAVLVAPYPHGGITQVENLRIELLAFATGALSVLATRDRPALGRAWIPLAALCAIAVLGVIQLLPLPEALLSRVSPLSLSIWTEARSILTSFNRPAPRAAISIAPSETSATILLALSYAALSLSAALLLRSRPRRRVFGAVVLAGSLGHIAYAAAQSEGLGRLHGSFINPNNFAGYLMIPLGFAFGVLCYQFRKRKAHHYLSRSEDFERRIIPVSLAVLLWGTYAAAIGLSRSRGGLLALCTSLPVLLFFVFEKRRRGTRGKTAPGIVLALLAAVLFAATITREGPLLRFLASDPSDLGSDGRVKIWRASVDAFRLFPVAGSGLGTFREAFRRVQPRGFDGLVEQAHDEPLQILVTGGVVGASLAIVLFGSAFLLLAQGFFRQEHREEALWVLSGLGALLCLTLHGLVEFNFSLPAIPATLATVVGGAWSAVCWREASEPASAENPFPRRV